MATSYRLALEISTAYRKSLRNFDFVTPDSRSFFWQPTALLLLQRLIWTYATYTLEIESQSAGKKQLVLISFVSGMQVDKSWATVAEEKNRRKKYRKIFDTQKAHLFLLVPVFSSAGMSCFVRSLPFFRQRFFCVHWTPQLRASSATGSGAEKSKKKTFDS
jgi:hypothetical protein